MRSRCQTSARAAHSLGEIEAARAELRAAPAPDARRRVVVIDPLEEVFSASDGARTTVFQLLMGLWALPWCTVIACMRADFYGALMAEPCWRELTRHQYAIPPLDDAGLRAAIVEPARRVGVQVDPALVERLMREIDRDRSSIPLPLLQVALKELWEQLTWRYLTLESYQRVVSFEQRGLPAALAVHADGVMQGLTPGDREMAQRVLLDLVHLGEGRPHTRRRRTLGELQRCGDAAGQLERVLDKLIEGRLVMTSDGDSGGGTRRHFDLAHDVLISGWGELAAWVRDREIDMAVQRRLEGCAHQWVKAQRVSGLLDERAAAEARAWRDSPGGKALGVSEWLVELIAASEEAHARTRRDREELVSCLLDARRKTSDGVSAAVRIVEEIVFQIDTRLQALGGASEVREALLAQARTLLHNLRTLDVLDRDVLAAEIAIKAAHADIAAERGDVAEAYRRSSEVAEEAKRYAVARPRDAARDGPAAWFAELLGVRAAMVDGDPANTTWRLDLARSLDKLGDIATAAGRLRDAYVWFESGLSVYRTLAEVDPANVSVRSGFVTCCEKLHNTASRLGAELQVTGSRTALPGR
jgi:hypothetical protein